MADRARDTSGVRLRRADLADAAAIARIHIASWRAVYQAELPAAYLDALDEMQRAEQWRQRLAAPEAVVVLAERDGRAAGFCAHGPARDAEICLTNAWEIYSLHVTPELRGSGIGSILFAEGRAAAGRAGADTLTLWVVATNLPAQRFYQFKAMQPDGGARRRELANGIALDEVRFRAPLA